jgi:hypothetical protein
MPLLDEDWTDAQIQGLLAALELVGAIPRWKPEHLQRLYDWCTAHQKDHNTVEGQLEFVAYDLCNSNEAVGLALKHATSVEEARAVVKPYVMMLTAHQIGSGPRLPIK